MGTFNISCGLSKLTIKENVKIYFQPLIATTNTLIGGTMYFEKNELFMPLCLPIIGEYDGYGGIKNIEKDLNTKYLEDFYEMNINDIIEIMTEINVDPYNKSSKYSLLLKNINWLDQSFPFEEILLSIGFKENGFNWKGDIFVSDYGELKKNENNEYELSLFSNDKYNYDFNLLNKYLDLNKKNRNINILKINNIITKKYEGIKNQKIFDLFLKTSGMFFIYELYESFSNNKKDISLLLLEHIDNYKTAIELYNKMKIKDDNAKHILLSYGGPLSMFYHNEYFIEIYQKALLNKSEFFINTFSRFIEFDKSMYGLNTMYIPQFQGQQGGNYELEVKLNKLCKEIINKKTLA